MFHLTDSSNNTEARTLRCIFPGVRESTHLSNIEKEDEPSELLLVSAPGAEPSCISRGGHRSKNTLPQLCRCSSAMLSKVMFSCYGCCSTLGRIPRGYGRPQGSPQEAGPESAGSPCTQVPACRSLLHHIHLQWPLLLMSVI